jgi:hypothetical protein
MYNPKQCFGCKHFDTEGDADVGWPERYICGLTAKLFDDGDLSEQASLVIEGILFALSDINNCPWFEDKYTHRRTILDLRKPEES